MAILTPQRIERHRSALHRKVLSRPLQFALADGLVTTETSIFDYGCGLGGDIVRLCGQGFTCSGWDPTHAPEVPRTPADLVNLGYVLNVIENPDERQSALLNAWRLARRVLIVSVRLRMEARFDGQLSCGDGYLTRINTFQKYYEQQELREYLQVNLKMQPVAAGPGVFYCFRDARERESFVAMRFRRSPNTPRVCKSNALYDAHHQLLDPLIEFVGTRGRLPTSDELASSETIAEVFGSVRRAFTVVRRVTGREFWDKLRSVHSEDLAIYLALARFEGRPRFSQLPDDIRRDVRAFFSSYKRACEVADELLFSLGDAHQLERACRLSEMGKQTQTALYLHRSALSNASAIVRAYEGCARMLVGHTEGANIIKLFAKKPAVSYLSYPRFEQDPHPALIHSLHVDLESRRTIFRDYSSSTNPPILHRKEDFLTDEHPLRDKFARLTRVEESWGLYANPSEIGHQQAWERLLERYGLRFRGHRLVRRKPSL